MKKFFYWVAFAIKTVILAAILAGAWTYIVAPALVAVGPQYGITVVPATVPVWPFMATAFVFKMSMRKSAMTLKARTHT